MKLSHACTLFAAGLWVTGTLAFSQPNFISARPGRVNYFEGDAFLNQQRLTREMLGKPFLNPNDTVSTYNGKAEILLTPGVFLRIGDNSEVQAKALSLIDVQIELHRGEAMIEVDQLTKDNSIRMFVDGSSALIKKPGLYRFIATQPASMAVISGKLEVSDNGRNIGLGKGNEVLLAQSPQKQHFDRKKEDDLYAWSNERAEYNSAASYQTAQTALTAANSPGWLWNDTFTSWAWVPGADLAFFSPFGYGFFGSGAVAYAPICYARTDGGRWRGPWHGRSHWQPIPVNPRRPPATGATPRSPWQSHQASAAALRTFSATGFRSSAGVSIPTGARITAPTASGHFWARGNNGPAAAGNGGHIGAWAHANSAGRGPGIAGGGGRFAGAGRSAMPSGAAGGHFGGGGGHFGGSSGGGHFGGGGFSGGHAGGGSAGGGGGHSSGGGGAGGGGGHR
ncbi:MAG TPA: hypothetical protein VFB14_19055 [Bryobacteraceae bacterium]|nr:hypothetical protein [Bryobacteraceae bacterium]